MSDKKVNLTIKVPGIKSSAVLSFPPGTTAGEVLEAAAQALGVEIDTRKVAPVIDGQPAQSDTVVPDDAQRVDGAATIGNGA